MAEEIRYRYRDDNGDVYAATVVKRKPSDGVYTGPIVCRVDSGWRNVGVEDGLVAQIIAPGKVVLHDSAKLFGWGNFRWRLSDTEEWDCCPPTHFGNVAIICYANDEVEQCWHKHQMARSWAEAMTLMGRYAKQPIYAAVLADGERIGWDDEEAVR